MTNVKEIYKTFDRLAQISHESLYEMKKLADQTGLSFDYTPFGSGYYSGTLKYEDVLKMVEDGSFKDLSDEDQERAEEVLETKKKFRRNKRFR